MELLIGKDQLNFEGGDKEKGNFSYRVQSLIAHGKGKEGFDKLKHFDSDYCAAFDTLKEVIGAKESVPSVDVRYVGELKLEPIDKDGKKRIAGYYALGMDIPVRIVNPSEGMILEKEIAFKGEDTASIQKQVGDLKTELLELELGVTNYPDQEYVDNIIKQKTELMEQYQFNIDNAPKDSTQIKKVKLYING